MRFHSSQEKQRALQPFARAWPSAEVEGVAGMMPMTATAVGAIRAVDTSLKLRGATGLVRDKNNQTP